MCPRNEVRSWSHASKVTNLKTFAKNLLAVRPNTALVIRKRKKRMAIAKRFAFQANAKPDFVLNFSLKFC